jgi:hypothetical protein
LLKKNIIKHIESIVDEVDLENIKDEIISRFINSDLPLSPTQAMSSLTCSMSDNSSNKDESMPVLNNISMNLNTAESPCPNISTIMATILPLILFEL